MQLSKHFKLGEFTKSMTATRKGIDNSPGAGDIKNFSSSKFTWTRTNCCLPPVVGAATVNQTFANNARFGNIKPVSGLTLSEEIYLDPLGKAYRRNQRQTNKQTKLT